MVETKFDIIKFVDSNPQGIGFITPDGEEEGENDILVHYEQIKQETEDGFKSLQAGSKVEYELAEDPKNADKQIAVKVTGPDGEELLMMLLSTGTAF